MKLWVDDVRPAPQGYERIYSVDDAMIYICDFWDEIEEINLDHDAGDYASFGGDYIEILNNLEVIEHTFDYFPSKQWCFKFHSANPVGVQNMKRICLKNNWKIL